VFLLLIYMLDLSFVYLRSLDFFSTLPLRPSVRSFVGLFVPSFGHRLHYSIARRLIGSSVAFVLRWSFFGCSLMSVGFRQGSRVTYRGSRVEGRVNKS